jgi:hypothetical protein
MFLFLSHVSVVDIILLIIVYNLYMTHPFLPHVMLTCSIGRPLVRTGGVLAGRLRSFFLCGFGSQIQINNGLPTFSQSVCLSDSANVHYYIIIDATVTHTVHILGGDDGKACALIALLLCFILWHYCR